MADITVQSREEPHENVVEAVLQAVDQFIKASR
jgi:hypothetical protein